MFKPFDGIGCRTRLREKPRNTKTCKEYGSMSSILYNGVDEYGKLLVHFHELVKSTFASGAKIPMDFLFSGRVSDQIQL